MKNALIRVIEEANSEKWCMDPKCTTCGAFSFREALRRIGGPQGWGIANELRDIDWEELVLHENWDNALTMSLMALQTPSQIRRVVEAQPAAPEGRLKEVARVLHGYVNQLPKDHIPRKKGCRGCLSSPRPLVHCQNPG